MIKKLKEYAFHMRKHALDMSYAAGSHAVHFGAGMSIIEILATLYGGILNLKKDEPKWEERDRFILSKGHGVIGYYAALTEYGYINSEELKKFEQGNSFLLGHPVISPEHGIEFSTGSLGMGLSLGIGTAIAAKKKKRDYMTYVLIGDGEADEGSIWEGFTAAAHYKLDNLCVIVDRNHMQLGGNTEDVMAHGDLRAKVETFGWDVYEVEGHDLQVLYDTFKNTQRNERPTIIIANTVKGKGFQFSENNNAWHHAVMTLSQYEEAKKELEESYYGH